MTSLYNVTTTTTQLQSQLTTVRNSYFKAAENLEQQSQALMEAQGRKVEARGQAVGLQEQALELQGEHRDVHKIPFTRA